MPPRNPSRPKGPQLTEAISATMVELYADFYGHDRTSATTYINDNIVVCVLQNILTQTGTEDEFTATIQRLTHRRVVAFMSANQTAPGVACELFFLDAAPLAASIATAA